MENAYAAGILDGEGHVTVGKDGSTVVSVSNTCLSLLEALKERYGGVVSVVHKADILNRRPNTCYAWRLRVREQVPFLEAVLPYLIVKKESARKTLALRYDREPWRIQRYQV